MVEVATRTCAKCGKLLPIDRFSYWTDSKTGKRMCQSFCKACKYEQKKAWGKRNPHRVKTHQQKHDAKNAALNAVKRQSRIEAEAQRKEIQRQADIVRDLNLAMRHIRDRLIPEGNAMRKGKKWCRYCKKEVEHTKRGGMCFACYWKKYGKAMLARKPKHELKAMRSRAYAAMKRDPIKLLRQRVRGRIALAMKRYARGCVKTGSNLKYLGCSAPQLAVYIEGMFKRGMAWSNYGEWHLDHVIPLASFDLATEPDRIKAFHYTNLQPLWAIDNIRKSDHVTTKAHQAHLILV
jgi:hypothetical protein